MTLALISREDIALELNLVDEEGALANRGVAELLRQPLSRWGLSPRRAVLRFAREQLDVAGLGEQVTAPEVGKVLDQLQAMGDCQEVSIGHERYVAPCTPRWIPTGEQNGVVLSVDPVPNGVTILEPTSQEDLVRRISVADEDDLTALHLAGVRRCPFDEWFRPLHYLRHWGRRLGCSVWDDALPLDAYWDSLLRSLTQEGLQIGEDAEVRVLSGSPGSFFGHYNSTDCEGRWSPMTEDGVWCGYRRGYGEVHWHPVIIAIDGRERRVLDLYDRDEWCWALLARGRAMGAPEQAYREGAKVKLSFPAPSQLLAAMDLLGPRARGWSWTLSSGAPDIWSRFL